MSESDYTNEVPQYVSSHIRVPEDSVWVTTAQNNSTLIAKYFC